MNPVSSTDGEVVTEDAIVSIDSATGADGKPQRGFSNTL